MAASREAGLSLSSAKLSQLRPWFFGWRAVVTSILNFIGPPIAGAVGSIRAQLKDGDANAAILLEMDPPLVAAYGEDVDSVALLTFPPGTIDLRGLQPGAKLVAVNYYRGEGVVEEDLKPGPMASGAWVDFHPLIGDFLSDDRPRLEQLRSLIPAEHWARCADLVEPYKADNPGKARDGRPGYGGLRNRYTAATR